MIKRLVPYIATCPMSYGMDGAATIGSAFTFVTRFKAPDDYYAYDVVIPNFTQNETKIIAIKVGTAPSLNGANSQGNPSAIYVDGVEVANRTLATGSASKPSLLISDPIGVAGSAGDIIELRTYIDALAGNGYTSYLSSSDTLPSGMTPMVASTGAGGDLITGNNSVYADSLDATTYFAMAYIRFYSKEKKINVLHCGDSLARGVCGASADGKYSPLFLASQLDTRISPNVYGKGGDSCCIFSRRSFAIASTSNISVAILPPFSPNDASSLWTGYFGVMLATASKLRTLGIIPLLTTPVPWDYSGGNLTLWQTLRSEVIRISGEWNLPYIDFSTVLEDPEVAGKLKDDYYSEGATAAIRSHPNPAGKLAEAHEIARVIGLLAT